MKKFIFVFFVLNVYWSNNVASSTTMFTPVEITLRTDESYVVSGITIKLLEARTKWTVSGDSALSASLEFRYKNKKEIVHLTSAGEVSSIEWETIIVRLLNGDNGLVNLNVSPGHKSTK